MVEVNKINGDNHYKVLEDNKGESAEKIQVLLNTTY